jgi:hypothetical protein
MAIKSQGALLAMETTRAAAKTITGITAASPPVVSSSSHGYTAGQIVYISGVVGMTQVNGRAFVVGTAAAGTFELKGVDGTSWTAYASAGSAYLITPTSVGQASKIGGFDGQAPEIDVTNLQSVAKEYLLGLQDFGNLSFDVFLDNTDTGQTALRAAKESGAAKVFTWTLSDAKVSAFVAYVKQFSANADADGAVTGAVQLRITGAPAWFA